VSDDLFKRHRNHFKVGDKVKFKDQVVMSGINKQGMAKVSEIIRKGTVTEVIPYGFGACLIIECYCVIDYCLFLKGNLEVEEDK